MAITIKNVNASIAKQMPGIELVKGEGYFYFIGSQASIGAESVFVHSLNELSVDEWIEEAKSCWVEKNDRQAT